MKPELHAERWATRMAGFIEEAAEAMGGPVSLAAAMGVDRKTIYNWIARVTRPPADIGDRLLVLLDERKARIRRLIKALQQETRGPCSGVPGGLEALEDSRGPEGDTERAGL